MQTAGHRIEPRVISQRQCDALLAALATGVRGRTGSRHLMSNPAVAELAAEDRLRKLAAGMLGRAAVPFRATLFEKTEQANWLIAWHQDTALPFSARFEAAGGGPWSIKAGVHYAHAPAGALERIVALRVHLDDSTPDNGPLRVVPGSKRAGVLTDEEVHAVAERHTWTECVVSRGGVVAMRPLLIHASSKSRNGELRRVLHIEYADSLDLRPGVRLAVT